MPKRKIQIELRWRRGSSLWHLDGSHPRYKLDRTFIDADATVKRDGGRLVYTSLKPGYYETREWSRELGDIEKKYWRVTEVTMELLPEGLDMAAISEAPAPNQPGSYMHDRCACGADVETYDENLLPACRSCVGAVLDADLPTPIGG